MVLLCWTTSSQIQFSFQAIKGTKRLLTEVTYLNICNCFCREDGGSPEHLYRHHRTPGLDYLPRVRGRGGRQNGSRIEQEGGEDRYAG